MKDRLRRFLLRSKQPEVQNHWTKREIKIPEQQPPGQPSGQPPVPGQPGAMPPPPPGGGPVPQGALENFLRDTDMPEDLTSPLKGNPSTPPQPEPEGMEFRTKLRRRRQKEAAPRGELTYG